MMGRAAGKILIVGSGVAACSAAIWLGRAGLEVVMLTRERADRRSFKYPRSIETVHEGIETIFSQLHIENWKEAIINSFDEIHCSAGVVQGATSTENWKGHHIDRAQLDTILIKQLANFPITIVQNKSIVQIEEWPGNVVKLTLDDNQTITGDFLIDASGRTQIIRRLLRWEQEIHSSRLIGWTGLSSDVPADHPLCNQTSFIKEEKGWTWTAPADFGQVVWTRLRHFRNNCQLRAPSDLELFNNHVLKCADVTWRISRPLAGKRVLLTGEAGAIIDPSWGQGIFNACLSAVIASDTILKAICEPEWEEFFMASYDQWFLDRFEYCVESLRSRLDYSAIEI